MGLLYESHIITKREVWNLSLYWVLRLSSKPSNKATGHSHLLTDSAIGVSASVPQDYPQACRFARWTHRPQRSCFLFTQLWFVIVKGCRLKLAKEKGVESRRNQARAFRWLHPVELHGQRVIPPAMMPDNTHAGLLTWALVCRVCMSSQ